MNIEKERSEFEKVVPVPANAFWNADACIYGWYNYPHHATPFNKQWETWLARAEKAEAEFASSIDAINERSQLRVENDELRALISDAAQSLCEQVRMPNIEHVADDHNDAVKAIRAVAHKLREQDDE